MAAAGKVCVVEVEEIVEVGELAPDDIHLPGIYVHRIVLNANPEKRIEKRTVSASVDAAAAKVEAQTAIAAAAAAGSEVPAKVVNKKEGA